MQKRIAELKGRIPLGGLREAIIRGLLFVGMARSVVDARGFETVRRIRGTESDVPLATFKAMVREQFYMLLLDTEGALAAIPSMLPPDAQTRAAAFELVKQALGARGEFSAEDRRRMNEVAQLLASTRVRRRRAISRWCPPPAPRSRRKHPEGHVHQEGSGGASCSLTARSAR